jgi:hypothetical protein
MITSTPDKVEQFVGGKKVLIAFGGSVLAAAVIGTAGYFGFHALLGNAWGTTVSQIVTLQVYMVLLITLCVRFRPVTEPPIALRPSGTQHAIASVGIWIATVTAIVLFYFCLGSIFGSVSQVAKQITAFATDAKRLQCTRRDFRNGHVLRLDARIAGRGALRVHLRGRHWVRPDTHRLNLQHNHYAFAE